MIIFLSILSASLFILLLLSYIDNARMRKALQTIQKLVEETDVMFKDLVKSTDELIQEAVKLELEKRK